MIAIAGAYQGKPLLEVWDSLSGDIQVTIKQTEPALGYRPVTSVALSPDGKTLFSYGKGDLCRQWEIASGEMKSEFSLASGVLFNAEQMDTVLGGAYGSSPARMTFTLYDFASSSAIRGFTERFYQTPNSLASACVSSDGKLLATSLSGRFHDGRTWGGGTVLVWNTKTGQMLLKVLARSGCLSMSFSRAGNFFAAADGPIIRLWETNSWTEIRKFEGHSATVYSLSFHPDGKRLASSSRDGTLRIWDVGTATKILTLSEGDSDTKCTIAFSPDGRFLASGNSTNGTVRIWKSGDLDVTSAAAPKVQQ
jgi:WD40 repeat protein